MNARPRNINPGQKRKQVDPALAAVITRIIQKEVERQVKGLREEILAALREEMMKPIINYEEVTLDENGRIPSLDEIRRHYTYVDGTYTGGDTTVPPYSTSFTTVGLAQEQVVSGIDNSTLQDDMDDLMTAIANNQATP